jgi:hypothetical protein
LRKATFDAYKYIKDVASSVASKLIQEVEQKAEEESLKKYKDHHTF